MVIMPIFGDTHTNSSLGLCPPYVALDDGGTYRPSPFQSELIGCFDDYVSEVAKLQNEYGGNICTVANGDLYDGDHHDTSQIISRNPATMHKIAWDVHKPLIDISDRVYIVRGTSVHTGKSGALEETFAEDIGAVQPVDGGVRYSWENLYLSVEGVRFDIAHHGRMGRLPHTQKIAAIRLATETAAKYTDEYREPPHLAIRSHQHRYADSFTNHRVRGIFLPCWQGKTEFINRIDPSAIPDIGAIIVMVDNGEYEVIVKRYKLAPPKLHFVEFESPNAKKRALKWISSLMRR